MNVAPQYTSPPPPDASATVSRWVAGNPSSDGFSLAEYIILIDASRTDPRIDGAEVLDLAKDEFHHAVYAAAPYTCRTCGGTRFVEGRTVVGSWADSHGPQLDVTDDPCPECVAGRAA